MNPSVSSLAASQRKPPDPRTGFSDWRGLRDRLLASARFRRLATAFPLTRPIARKRARALFDLCAGFVYSQTLLACVRLDLFEMLSHGPLSPAAVGARAGLNADAAARLLAAAASLRLLERRRGGLYGLGPLGAALLGDPGISAMIEHHTLLYADLADPVALLRGETVPSLAGLWPYAKGGKPAELPSDRITDYSALMAASQPMVAAEILTAYPVGRHRNLLDIGGGDGAFVREVARVARETRLTVYDLPAVAERARSRFAAERIDATAIGGDIRTDPPAGGYDLVTLVRVIHDHDDDVALMFLRAARAALSPGGTVLIAEPMAGSPGSEPVGDAYFGFYLLAMGSGRARTVLELQDLMVRAGFSRCRVMPTRTPLVTSVLVGQARP